VAVRRHSHIIVLSAVFLGKTAFYDIVTMPWKWASTQRQRLEAFYLGKSTDHATTMIYNRTIGHLSRQICLRQDRNHVPKWASTERQRFVRWLLGSSNWNGAEINHNEPIGSVCRQKCYQQYRVRLLQLSAHGVSRLRTLHSNKLHYAVPKLSFTRSVVAICPCIQLHKYSCNVLLIWLFSL
jgi:hypothetical protein